MTCGIVKGRTEHAGRLRLALNGGEDRYGLLLLLLIFSYVLSAFTATRYSAAIESLLFVVTLLLALRTSRVRRPIARYIVVASAIGTTAAVALAFGHASDIGIGIANILSGLILFVTVAVIIRHVLSRPSVSLQSIFGAVSAYMIIGLMFASLYSAISHLESGPFFANGQPGDSRTFQYFSFTTLTTLGYGDFTAATNGGRAVAVMEALGGQVFLATLVARLVAAYRSPRSDGAAPAAGPPAAAQDRPDRHPGGNAHRGPLARPPASHRPPVKWRHPRRR